MKARFLALWTVAVLAAAASFIMHLALRFETVRLGYEVGAARKEQRRLTESLRLLSLEAATLRQADRVEAVARGSLDMELPDATRVITLGERTRTPSAGGAR